MKIHEYLNIFMESRVRRERLRERESCVSSCVVGRATRVDLESMLHARSVGLVG